MARRGRPRRFDEDAVVDRATDEFWAGGYAATSMRTLSDELGVLPGSLHAAFGSKRALFLRSLENFAEMSHASVRSIATSDAPLQAVRALLESVLDAAREAPGRGCMLGNTAIELLPHDDEARAIVHRGLRSFEQGVENGLRAAQQAGEVRTDIDCHSHARLLVVLVQGLHVTARAARALEELDDVIDAALAALTTPSTDDTTDGGGDGAGISSGGRTGSG